MAVQRRKGRFCVIPPRYQEDMVRGMKKGAKWEKIVYRWPFRKGVDHNRGPSIELGRGPSPELDADFHLLALWRKACASVTMRKFVEV
jgi:hypothetical protein